MEPIDRYKPAPDEGRLTGKILIITGSTQGLGESIAMRAAYLGAAGIVIVGRNRANGEQVARAVEQVGAQSLYAQADLARVEDCEAIIAACDQRFGRVDGLVNAAGVTSRGTLDSTSAALWDEHFAVNVRAPFLLIQGVARMMRREQIRGSIVNIVTMAAHVGEPLLTPYTSSKAALATMTKNVAYQLQPYGIRVNGLNIGWTDTPAEHVVQVASGQPENWLEIDGPKQTLRSTSTARRHCADGHVSAERPGDDGHGLGYGLGSDDHGAYGEHVSFE